jgi:phage shock protein C
VEKTIEISLGGRAERFRLEQDAYDRLARYLDRAGARLPHDADRAEVLGDLERAVADRLSAIPGDPDRVIGPREIDGVIEAIGGVGADADAGAGAADWTPRPEERRRRLVRIHEGKQMAGVCTGLAAYADIDVNWVRFVFLVATTFTAGAFALVYVALAFILRIVPTAQDAR